MGCDAAGRQTLLLDARGNRTTYAYDAGSRLTSRRYPDGTRATLAYDAVDRRTLAHDSLGRYTTVYDDAGRTRSVVNPAGKKITYSYDAASQRRVMIEPEGGRFTYSHDDAGRLRFLLNPQSDRTTWQYDAAGRTEVQRLANGTRASYTYDAANRLLELWNMKSNGDIISSFGYALDNVGNRTRVVEADSNRVTWSYDPTYQLTRERRSGAHSYDITYGYDPAQNRKLKLDGGARTTYAYDAANQLQTVKDNTGTTTFTFDASGNQRTEKAPSGGITTNTWDFENRLTRVHLASGVRNTFAYEPDGLRVRKDDSEGTTKFVWDGKKLLMETNQSDVAQAVYTQSLGMHGDLISQRRSGTSTYYHEVCGPPGRATAPWWASIEQKELVTIIPEFGPDKSDKNVTCFPEPRGRCCQEDVEIRFGFVRCFRDPLCACQRATQEQRQRATQGGGGPPHGSGGTDAGQRSPAEAHALTSIPRLTFLTKR